MIIKKFCARTLLVAFIAAAPTFAHSKTDMNACYGETLEVSMVALEKTDETDGSIVIALPEPQKWSVRVGNGIALEDLPCQIEPVAIKSAWGNALTDRDGKSPIFPEHLNRMSIVGSASTNTLDGFGYDRTDLIAQKGRNLPEGFRGFLTASPGGKVDSVRRGVFQFPAHHVSPLGETVFWSCGSWSCRGGYGFLDKLLVSYQFRNTNATFSDWIKRDRDLQTTITNWFH